MDVAGIPRIGEMFALGAAVTWAFALVLFKQSGETVRPLPLNLFKNVGGLTLIVVTMAITGELLDVGELLTPYQMLILAVSGVLGIAVADTLFFACLNRVGVQLNSVIDCLYTPFMFFFAWLALGERVDALQLLGVGTILIAVLITSGVRPLPGQPRTQIISGVLFGIGAMSSMSYGIVLAKPVLEQVPLLTASSARLLAGTVALMLIGSILPGRREMWRVFRPQRTWRRAIPATILGTYVSMLLWMGGFKYTDVSVAAILNQSSIVFSILLASIFLKERMTRAKWAAVTFGGGGVLLATLHEHILTWWAAL